MKEKILKIINAPSQSEPIYQLEAEYKSLSDDDKKKEFLSIIKCMALNGSDKQKFASLTTIEFLNQAKECEDVIKSNVERIVFNENEKLISPLLTLCAMLSVNWAIDFIKKIIEYYKPKSNEYSYYFDIGIRSIVSTPDWKEAINEIKWIIKNYDDDSLIDFLAYFKWISGDAELEELFQILDNKNFEIDKINNLETKIKNSYINNYGKLRQIK
jgi:hypothetical protein